MAPPSTRPVLPRIDPAALAIETARTAVDHVLRLQMDLFGLEEASAPDPQHTEIRRTVQRLAHYAVTGDALDAPVAEYLISLIPLWSAAEGNGSDVDVGRDADPDTELGLVIVAALAREQLDTGIEPLTTAQLAALSGSSQRLVQQLVASGELAAEDGAVAPAEARRWLAARAVPGVSAPTTGQRISSPPA